MLKNILIVGTTLSLLGLAQCGFGLGKCPQVKLQDNFDATQYTGVWFEQARDKGMPWESGNCQQARYTLKDDGSLKVYNTQFNEKTGKVEGTEGTAECNGAQCTVQFYWYSPKGDYRVVATDYKSYSLVYSCTDILGYAKADYVWLLTRDQDLTDDLSESVKNLLIERVPDYNLSNIYRTSQGGTCQYIQ